MAAVVPATTTGTAKPLEDVERALVALALCGGNSRQAADLLAENDTAVPDRTIRLWRTKYAGRYAEIRQERGQQIERLITSEARGLALRYADLEHRAIDEATGKIEGADLKDLSGLIKSAAVAKAVNIDKVLVLEGRPNQISEHRGDPLKRLQAKGYVDTVGEEEPENT